MSPSMTSLSDVLRDTHGADLIPPERSTVELQDVPSTEVVELRLDNARSALEMLRQGGISGREIIRAETMLRDAERLYADAVRRDMIATDRPAGCWCLGAGGKGVRYLPMPSDAVVILTSTSGDGTHDGEERPSIVEHETLSTYCDACHEGRARRLKDDRLRNAYRSHRRAIVVNRLFGHSQIPPEYRRYPWRSIPKPNAVRQVAAWLDDHGDHPWLLLWGEPGRGKTTLLSGLASESVEAGRTVLFRPLPDLLQEIKATFNPTNPTNESELIQLLKTVPELYLDDIGAENPSGWEGDRLYQILNHRHNEHLLTALSSNLGPKLLADRLGERLYGRIKRMALPVYVGGKDLRDLDHGAPVPRDLESD